MRFQFHEGELPVSEDNQIVVRCPYCHEAVACEVFTENDTPYISLHEYYQRHKDCFPDTCSFDMQIPRPKGNGDE